MYCIVTTINKPTRAIEKLYEKFGNNLIIVGDKKTPQDWAYNGVRPIMSPCEYAPYNHYSRKNEGYIMAMELGAKLIYDTDDDNVPNENWKIRELVTSVSHTSSQEWCNIYEPLTNDKIWPRGFPLNLIKQKTELRELNEDKICPIQQGLSDKSPDVDAIWRLIDNRMVYFWVKKRIWLKNSWCPFNSQSTWWFPKAYPLMYLPVTVSFRMTDIWRGFIAQKCLWALGYGITFHSPSETVQDRNSHDLMSDFEQEIDGYRYNERLAGCLYELKLKEGDEFVCENLLSCYLKLVDEGIIHSKEIYSVKAWIKECKSIV